ncbi:MAG: hypothetical protein H0V66_00205 [Bdellovibrionales bacterium]|nr:hypothetical protein [Bdellovibrionales bacterium]
MTWKSFCTSSFFFFFFAFMAVHFAYMKTPAQDRYVASHEQVAKPMYDAAWKL